MIKNGLIFPAVLCMASLGACATSMEPHVDKAEAVPVAANELRAPITATPVKKPKPVKARPVAVKSSAPAKKKYVLSPPPASDASRTTPKRKPASTPHVMGWVETIQVGGAHIEMKAKLDSGAKTSAIHAEIIKTIEKNDKNYVLFRIDIGDGKTEVFEERVKRWVRIKKKDEGFIRRPVVEMEFCVGNHTIKQEVSLADRDHFNYPVLIGRNMLQGKILVDTSKTYTTDPQCS